MDGWHCARVGGVGAGLGWACGVRGTRQRGPGLLRWCWAQLRVFSTSVFEFGFCPWERRFDCVAHGDGRSCCLVDYVVIPAGCDVQCATRLPRHESERRASGIQDGRVTSPGPGWWTVVRPRCACSGSVRDGLDRRGLSLTCRCWEGELSMGVSCTSQVCLLGRCAVTHEVSGRGVVFSPFRVLWVGCFGCHPSPLGELEKCSCLCERRPILLRVGVLVG